MESHVAKRPALIKRKPKVVRRTRSEAYIINKKHMGDEPVFTGPLSKTDYIGALNWYNYMSETGDSKEYVIEYLVNLGKNDVAKKIKALSDSQIPNTLAWTLRLLSKGYELSADARDYVKDKLRELVAEASEQKEINDNKEAKPVVSIQDRMRERSHDIIGEIEGLIDDYIHNDQAFSLYDWLKTNDIPAAYANTITSKLAPVLSELIEALEGKDAQLKEGYRGFTKSKLRDLIAFYDSLCEDVSRYAGVAKKTRAPRKPRVQSVEKKLKSFKYQKEDSTFKIASLSPEKIVGAQELWTFNTKYKTLSVFRALDRGGLDVKGASIIKYDEATSVTMRTGRKPEEAIKKVIEGGKLILRKIDQELKHNASLQARISESTILLRVVQ
jgi:hypothetical protein